MDSVTPLAAVARLFLALGALGSAATDFAELRKVEETEVTFIIVDTMWVFVSEVLVCHAISIEHSIIFPSTSPNCFVEEASFAGTGAVWTTSEVTSFNLSAAWDNWDCNSP